MGNGVEGEVGGGYDERRGCKVEGSEGEDVRRGGARTYGNEGVGAGDSGGGGGRGVPGRCHAMPSSRGKGASFILKGRRGVNIIELM